MKRFLPIATVFLPVALLYSFGALEFLERSRMDAEFRLAEREASADVVVVEIDPRSLSALGVWPWPRGYHATVLERLLDAGARRVGIDVDFSSRSIADEDATLAEAVAAARGRVVLPVFRQWQEAEPDELHLVVVEPLPELARHATLASINVRPETDGLVRRYTSRIHLKNRALPAFAVAMAGDPRPDLESFYLDFSISSRSIPRVSFVDVLTGRFDPSLVRDKAVIIGSTAVELGDQIAVPISAALPGPLLQGLAFESLLQDRALLRTSPVSTLAVALLLTLLIAPALVRMSWRAGLLLTSASSAGVLGLAGALEQLWPILLDVTPWVFSVVGVYGFSLVMRIDQQALRLLRQRVAIRRTETLMRHVVQNSFDAIVTLDAEGKVETCNRAAEFMFGHAECEIRGSRLAELVSSPPEGASQDLLVRAAEGPTEAVARCRDGRRFAVEVVVTAMDVDEDPKLVAVIRDITERKAHQEELKFRATHDPLTGLPNRVLLVERIEEALEEASRTRGTAAVLLLDLDRFKEINEALGHGVGDTLLKVAAKRLEEPLRPGDTLARLGGDEFAALLPATSERDARRIGRQLIEVLGLPFNVEGFSLEVDASLGITLYPAHGVGAETLVQRADVAMYVAKQERSGLVVYGPDQDVDRLRKLTIKSELRSAIEQGRLELAFQPKVHHATDEVVGAEALLRWHHPERGFIPPDEFVGVAEHSGLIRPLTQWVLETSLAQAARWKREGLALGISVNLSARNLLEEDLPPRLETLLARAGLAPGDLTLEITESVIMDDPDRSLATMRRLRESGIGIAVDDFGTGYSSLAYLTRLPVDELKIDKSFVMNLDRDPGCTAIVRSTIDLAHEMGMLVVAEGVESEAIWSGLKQLGCDVGQGYHFSRPVPAGEFLAIARQRRGLTPIPQAAFAGDSPTERPSY
jgi:diguanylate cyclase (GGDEF)-like protein/PAS domain S-box-containing protein